MRLLGGSDALEGLSDDRIVVREIDGAFRAFGTPWPGTEAVVSADGARLGAIAFLHQAPETCLRRVALREALEQLLRTASVPWFDPEGASRCLGVCESVLSGVPLYELHFRKHAEVSDVLSELF
jgi:hypothetical protein